jgi:hypothetical protein
MGGTTKSTKKTTTKKDVAKRETANGAKSTKSAASNSVRFSGTKELVGWKEFCQWECPAGLGEFKCKLRCDLSEGKALSAAASPLQLIKKTQRKRWLGKGVPVEETTKVVKTFSEVKDTISSFFQDLTADSLDEVMARLDNVDDDLEFSLPLAEAHIICLGDKQLSTGSLDELLRNFQKQGEGVMNIIDETVGGKAANFQAAIRTSVWTKAYGTKFSMKDQAKVENTYPASDEDETMNAPIELNDDLNDLMRNHGKDHEEELEVYICTSTKMLRFYGRIGASEEDRGLWNPVTYDGGY